MLPAILGIGALIAIIAASPIAVDIAMGESITPDSPLFGMEQTGEQMRLALGNIGHGELFQERVREFRSLNWTDPEKLEALEASLEAVNAEMRAYTEGMEINESNWYEVMAIYNQMLREVLEAHNVPQQVRDLLTDWQNRQGGH